MAHVGPRCPDRPLPYPDGWFAVAFSSELKPGTVLRSPPMGPTWSSAAPGGAPSASSNLRAHSTLRGTHWP